MATSIQSSLCLAINTKIVPGVNNCEVLHVWVFARQRIQVNLTLKSGSAHFWMKKLLNTLHDRPTPGGTRDKEQVSGVSGV